MADIKVVIQLQDTAEDEITDLGSSSEVNNASIQKTNGSFGSLSTKNDGTNMKSWANVIKDSEGNVVSKVVNGETISRGILSLADGYVGGADTKLVEQYGYNGYVFGAVPESKQLTVTLEVRGENIDSIIIYGDKNANQFPTKAYRDGDTNDVIYSDDATWAIKFDSALNSHSITFLEWNRTNYNACITYVAELKKELTLDKSWIKSVESLSQSTGQPKDIYYGITSSNGSSEILDINDELYDYINDGIIGNANLKIDIYANGKSVQSHITKDTSYDNSKILSFELYNSLSKWDNIKFKGIEYSSNTSLLNILESIFLDTGYVKSADKVYSMLDDYTIHNGLQVSIKEYLSNINIPYPYLKSSSLREAVDKVCALAQLNVIENNIGEIKFVSSRPIVDKNKTIIKITPRQIVSKPYKDVIVKNKYNGINLTQNKVIDAIDYNALIYEKEDISIGTTEMVSSGVGKGFVSSGIFKGWGARILQRNYYMSGSFVMPQQYNYGLEKVLSVKEKDSEGKFLSYSVVATKTTGKCVNNYFTINETNIETTPSSYGTIVDSDPTSSEEVTVTLDAGGIEVYTEKAQASLPSNNSSYIKSRKNDNGDFVIDYKVIVKQETWTLSADGTEQQQM